MHPGLDPPGPIGPMTINPTGHCAPRAVPHHQGTTVKTNHPTTSGKLDNALSALIALIADGYEYPDAHTKIAIEHGVDGDALRDAYDNSPH